ncbi:hypothetical protein KFZ70_17050 [Tamlana fucoidanivorans]|uniref:Glycosyl-hydrolase family 116 catalytic region domain-containing protein n=1 Tax=Allotamlana fucoidanivorans TaxID=2583814 RepID=A0A5C4SJ76_9FLAO|nr:GH116 family glycosyl hydrolase [Tamlana fucoidanivorans]TNJ43505.1 hypothetical protein FGF67_11340 [Tamlana fucoidanivorans]
MIQKKYLFLVFSLLPLGLFAQHDKNDAYIPLEKNIDADWVKSLYEKGEQKVYKGAELKWIGMPCGGIGTGQVYITGDGELCFFESVYNQQQQPNAGHGLSTGYQYLYPQERVSKVKSSFSIAIKEEGKDATNYSLTSNDFNAIEFIGEYPLAKLKYEKTDEELPVEIRSEVFSPFVPLNVRSSANPVIVLKYALSNTSDKSVEININGILRNIHFPEKAKVEYRNSTLKSKGVSGISFEMKPLSSDSTLLKHPQLGGFTLSVLDTKAELLTDKDKGITATTTSKEPVTGSVGSSITLKPNQTKEITFLISWYFPNYYENGRRYKIASAEAPGWVGHIYNNWYNNSNDVAKYVAANFDDLYGKTKLFRESYNDNTLPYWLSNRITMPVSTLAAGNVAIWENGRFYAYEGVGFCMGTCGHVYNFVTAISKLFPELERSVRLLQDFNYSTAYSTSGRINFRGYLPNDPNVPHSYASDAQSGYVLKAYREHLMSPNNDFLDSIWEQVKGAIGYHIFKDGAEIGLEPNGVLEGEQTFWDPMWYGPNPYNNTLYLAALRAAEEMAIIQGEPELAARYHAIFKSGQKFMDEKMWNGEFYYHLYPVGFNGNVGVKNGFKLPEEIDDNARSYVKAFNEGRSGYFPGTACDAQQLFGQNWANQLGLGYILSPEKCKKAAKSIFKYNWTPDIATIYDFEKPNARVLAAKGEAAMINGGWSKEKPRSFENTHDKTNVWTGLEYEASCDMINEGLLDEALVSIRSIHDRYDGAKRNPWSEVEGSDHYSRAMHSWNILLAISGFTFDGPAGKLGFAPKLDPKNFKSFFSAAESWGNISQTIEGGTQTQIIELKYGKLRLKQMKFSLNEDLNKTTAQVFIGEKTVQASVKIDNSELIVIFDKEIILQQGQVLKVII